MKSNLSSIVAFGVFLALVTVFSPAAAQQGEAKAYEKVTYIARLNGVNIRLIYADGYIGASEIRIGKANKNQVFVPDSGAADDNGDLKFYPKTAIDNKKNTYFVLKNIDETLEAPPVINGEYFSGGKKQILRFRRSG